MPRAEKHHIYASHHISLYLKSSLKSKLTSNTSWPLTLLPLALVTVLFIIRLKSSTSMLGGKLIEIFGASTLCEPMVHIME